MKLAIVFLLSVFSIGNSLSQTESPCPCEHLNTSGAKLVFRTTRNCIEESDMLERLEFKALIKTQCG